MNVAAEQAAKEQGCIISAAVLGEKDKLIVHAGTRVSTLKPATLTHYRGKKGQSGKRLPRGLWRADRLTVELA